MSVKIIAEIIYEIESCGLGLAPLLEKLNIPKKLGEVEVHILEQDFFSITGTKIGTHKTIQIHSKYGVYNCEKSIPGKYNWISEPLTHRQWTNGWWGEDNTAPETPIDIQEIHGRMQTINRTRKMYENKSGTRTYIYQDEIFSIW